MPWERARLAPREIDELYEGMFWRRSRLIEVIAKAVQFLAQVQTTSDVEFDRVLGGMPNYDHRHERRIDDMRKAGIARMKAKVAKGKRA